MKSSWVMVPKESWEKETAIYHHRLEAISIPSETICTAFEKNWPKGLAHLI